jgi:hypothetical protein
VLDLDLANFHPDADGIGLRVPQSVHHVIDRAVKETLREGMAETLTVSRLGITGSLKRTLASTNPCESMIEIARRTSRNVKRWQSGDMCLRWTAEACSKPSGSSGRSAATATSPGSPSRSSATSTVTKPRTCYSRSHEKVHHRGRHENHAAGDILRVGQ